MSFGGIQGAKIKVFGIGGGGSNAVNRMIEEGVEGVEFYIANTDLQAIQVSKVENKIILGELGAGSNPDVGRECANKHEKEIKEAMEGADMVYIAAGMGGGTGTGAAPVFAKVAKELGILTIGIVTKPFSFEGPRRKAQAESGLKELRQNVDSLIIVSNDQLLGLIGRAPMQQAFKEADNVLRQGVQTVTDLITVPALINLDFADVKSVMEKQGNALIGIGMASGEDKATKAASKAVESPLLEAKICGAKKAVINITGGDDITLQDASDAVETIKSLAGGNLDIIFGIATNPELKDDVVVTIIATGFDDTLEKVSVVQAEPKPKTFTKPKEEVVVEPLFGSRAKATQPSYNAQSQNAIRGDGFEIPSYVNQLPQGEYQRVNQAPRHAANTRNVEDTGGYKPIEIKETVQEREDNDLPSFFKRRGLFG